MRDLIKVIQNRMLYGSGFFILEKKEDNIMGCKSCDCNNLIVVKSDDEEFMRSDEPEWFYDSVFHCGGFHQATQHQSIEDKIGFLRSEIKEFAKAWKDFEKFSNDPMLDADRNYGQECQALENELLKELCDVQYVVDSLFSHLCLDGSKISAMKEVHRSNMSKLDKFGDPLELDEDTGKIKKGPNFSPADMTKVKLFDNWNEG